MNLSFYEQHAQEEALRQLEELQTKRRAAKQAAGPKAESDTNQFVYSTVESGREASRPIPHEAPRPDREDRKSPLKQAA